MNQIIKVMEIMIHIKDMEVIQQTKIKINRHINKNMVVGKLVVVLINIKNLKIILVIQM